MHVKANGHSLPPPQGQKITLEANSRHAWEEKLGREFLWETRTLKSTCMYEDLRKPHTRVRCLGKDLRECHV